MHENENFTSEEAVNFNPQEKIDQNELPKNVVEVETKNAYYRIMYEKHTNTEFDPAEIDSADALASEGECVPIDLPGWMTEESKIEEAYRKTWESEKNSRYHKMLAIAKERKLPVFSLESSEISSRETLEIFLKAAEPVTGIYLLASLFKKPKEPITRRDFLKKLGKGVLGAYLASSSPTILTSLGNNIDRNSARRSLNRLSQSLEEEMHPEANSVLVTFRNHLMAQRAELCAKVLQNNINKKPVIAIKIGSAHTGIEDALQEDPEEREKTIRNIQGIAGVGEASYALKTEWNDKENAWKTTRIPFYNDSQPQ